MYLNRLLIKIIIIINKYLWFRHRYLTSGPEWPRVSKDVNTQESRSRYSVGIFINQSDSRYSHKR